MAVDALTATGIDLGTPTVGSPAITQRHNFGLGSNDFGTPKVGSPALTEGPPLPAVSISVDAIVSTAVRGGRVFLTAAVVGAQAALRSAIHDRGFVRPVVGVTAEISATKSKGRIR